MANKSVIDKLSKQMIKKVAFVKKPEDTFSELCEDGIMGDVVDSLLNGEKLTLRKALNPKGKQSEEDS